MTNPAQNQIEFDYSKYGFRDEENYTYKSAKGLNEEIVRTISRMKNEPEWMLQRRLKALDIFNKKPLPVTGMWANPKLAELDFQDIFYYVRPGEKSEKSWDDVPENIKNTFEKLGIPEAEQKFLAGVGAQYESESVYHSLREEWQKQGVVFLDMDTALREYPEIVKEHFGTIIPAADNKFAALNTAVWSGGSFVYVPKGVKVTIPLQAYFRINAENMGQFERTLIIVDEDADVTYIEGCTAPVYTTNSLHSAVVEIIVRKGGRCRYTTIQNWSNNIFNLVTKRAVAYEDASMEWVDGNIGCLAEGSTVTTPTGIKTIESLELGDHVLSYDDQTGQLVFRSVIAKRYSGEQPVHTVNVGERKLVVTANHPFYSYTYNPDAAKKLGRYELAYVRADHLKEAIVPRTSLDYGAPYQLQKPWLVTEFQSLNQYNSDLKMSRTRESRMAEIEYTTDDMMWMFGYWVGDGNIEIKAAKTEGVVRFAKVGFSTPRTDRARGRLVETMAALVDAKPTERADGVHLNWNSKELAEFFTINGFKGRATDKRVPTWVWSLPESQRLAFVAGYLDADGTVTETKRRFSLKSANQQLLADVASLLVTLGITSRLQTEFSEPRTVTILGYECTAHGSYRLDFALDSRLLPFVSNQLREKATNCVPVQNQYNRTVGRSQIQLPESVEIVNVSVSAASAELVRTWDIEVEDTGNFVSQGFIVHNSRLTMKYPAVYLMGRGAKGEVLSVAYAGEGQHQDAGAKMVHAAPDTTSRITNKSVSKNGGRTTYRGLAKVLPGAHNAKVNVVCDALILDDRSASDTIPYIEIEEDTATIAHEATVGKIGEEQLFYLMSRGLDEAESLSMIVLGFMEPFTRELPMEYAVELNRLIQMEMEGSVG